MAWVVDSCVLLDIRMNDANFGLPSARCLAAHLSEGLTIAPITYVELAPAFGGDAQVQNTSSSGPASTGRHRGPLRTRKRLIGFGPRMSKGDEAEAGASGRWLTF